MPHRTTIQRSRAVIGSLTLGIVAAIQAVAATPGEFTNSIGMKFVRIEPGSFLMGQEGPRATYNVKTHAETFNTADADEQPVHRVKISMAYSVATTEVTLAQYRHFDPQFGKGADDEAVSGVTWKEAAKFCEWLSTSEGKTYRLPTEAEWEYACRAGTQTAFNTGDRLPDGFLPWWTNTVARDRYFPDKLPPEIRSGPGSMRVGQTSPNAWGLYDMHGNVAEWCADWYGPYAPGEQVDPLGRADGDFRVFRGGSHSMLPRLLRSANRGGWLPESADSQTGFRVVLGEWPKGQRLPLAEPLPTARNIDQTPAQVTPLPAEAPFFSGPVPFVKIPPNSDRSSPTTITARRSRNAPTATCSPYGTRASMKAARS